MTELEFLNGEAKIASMAAPKGLAISVVNSDQEGKFDVLFGGRVVARLLGREEALAAVMGIGGALTILKPTKAVKGRKRAIKSLIAVRRIGRRRLRLMTLAARGLWRASPRLRELSRSIFQECSLSFKLAQKLSTTINEIPPCYLRKITA